MCRAVLVAAACLCWTSGVWGADRPNVLFISVDDLNDWVGCLGGHPDCRSPNIDRLAARGVLFERAYCAAPACNPSRASVMTGVRPWTSGVYRNPQPWRPAMPEVVTLPQHFTAHGYHSGGSGKIFHGRYEDPASWEHYLKRGGDPRPAPKVRNDPHSRAGGIVWGALDVDDAQMNDYAMADYAIEYLSQEHDKPFFLACGIFRPHLPWQVPRRYYEMYPLDAIELPEVPAGDLDDIPPAGVRMARPSTNHAKVTGTDNWRHAVQAYLASITFADAQIGRVLDGLDNSPHKDNTIIILWADHGWHLGEKEHWRKFALWEEATRVPLMVVAPGVTSPGQRCGRTVDLMNIYPTLCELCDLPIPEHTEGISMLPLLRDPQTAWERPAMTTFGRGSHAVRSEQYRYIRYANGDEELYDHDVDPMEWTNLAADESLADVKQELAKWIPRSEAEDADYDRRQAPGKARRGRAPKRK